MYQGIHRHKELITAFLSALSIALVALLVMAHVSSYAASSTKSPKPSASTGDWSRYMYSDTHQGNNPTETILNSTNVSSLKLKWKFHPASALIAEPILVNGVIYQGANDGYMYAIDATTQQQLWSTFLGRHSIAACPVSYGVTGTAAVENGMVYIGEGYTFYALNAATGQIAWQTPLAINSNLDDNIIWGPAAVANGKVYIGLASDCDKPLIQGVLYALDASTGTIVAEAKMVPDGFVGGGIWTAPTIDANTGTVIVSTGSVEKVPPVTDMSAAIVTLDWNTLAVKQHWQVPAAERIGDADWGATPTFFPGPSGKTYIGCMNKNSIYYVFDEAQVSAGPIWEMKLGQGGRLAGLNASFASSAYVNGVLFIASALTTINNTSYSSSIGAFDALTGQQLWRFGLPGHIFASVTTANGLLFDGQGNIFEVRDQGNGQVLFSYTFPSNSMKGPATVLDGLVYVPAINGNLYVFGL
jgi:outer membrane protein assembly factor BamB